MEFDTATYPRTAKTLFQTITDKYHNNNYQMPKLIFWNVNSRTGTIPVKENENGVILVSGFSVNVCKMVLSDKTDPFEALVETLMDKRYDSVSKVMRDYHSNK